YTTPPHPRTTPTTHTHRHTHRHTHTQVSKHRERPWVGTGLPRDTLSKLYSLNMRGSPYIDSGVCVCVCMCVCGRENERGSLPCRGTGQCSCCSGLVSESES